MAYEKYKTIRAKTEFFNDWDKTNVAGLSEEMKEYIYQKYVTKCRLLKRDKFTCQIKIKTMVNKVEMLAPCPYCNNQLEHPKLTWHHIKHKRNNGSNNERNGVIWCKKGHAAFNAGKVAITCDKDAMNLPPHIRGHTFKLERTQKVNWKKIKAEMKQLRSELKSKLNQKIKELPIGQRTWYNITWEQIYLLMRWLETSPEYFEEIEED